MSAEQLIEQVRYVTDAQGNRAAVLLDFTLWEMVLAAIKRSELLEPTQDSLKVTTQEGWAAFLDMAQRAIPGKLIDASENHDKYLYPSN